LAFFTAWSRALWQHGSSWQPPGCALRGLHVAAALGMLLATGRVAAVGIACTWHPGHAAAEAIDLHLKAAFAAADG